MQQQNPFHFKSPEAQLNPRMKSLCQDLRKHGFCIFRDEMIREMTHLVTRQQIKDGVDPKGKLYEIGRQLAMFREACRWISIERGENLIMRDVPDEHGRSHMFIVCAPLGHDGDMPEGKYDEDKDGKGIHTRETVPVSEDPGPSIEIHTNSLRG